jgi:hypothetical protein
MGGLSCKSPLFLIGISVPGHKDVISSVLSGIQDDHKVNTKRMA